MSSSYKCLYCSRTFANPYALKWHISNKHRYVIDEDEELTTQTNIVEEPGLWDEDDTMEYSEEPGLWDEDVTMEYSEVMIIRYQLL